MIEIEHVLINDFFCGFFSLDGMFKIMIPKYAS